MSYEILDSLSRADIAYRVRGKNLSETFSAGAKTLASIMMQNPEDIRPATSITITCAAPDVELLYFDFLSEFIYYKDSERIILIPEKVEISQSTDGYNLACIARGEKIDRARHRFTVDIKAITMHNLSVIREDNGWSATVVVDV
ncbi:MAG: hypothetical protein A2176_15770 [Spirochaetes bacterium RBG_13_51_14]|nr:MAG: hypothetical protein A2176_15770 [Spirochaetes bacterium RBG_13_51_14]